MTTLIWFIASLTTTFSFVITTLAKLTPIPEEIKPCLPYVEVGSTYVGPSNLCCDGVKNELDTCQTRMCAIAASANEYTPTPIDQKRFLGLTDICCLSDGPIDCTDANPPPQKPPTEPTPSQPAPSPPLPSNLTEPPTLPPEPTEPEPTPTFKGGAAGLYGSGFMAVSSLVVALFL